MTEGQTIYLAGFIDGEGCISIKYVKKSPPELRLSITNTNEEVIKLIGKWVKGRIYCHKVESKKYKDSWRFVATGKNAVKILEGVYPYLVVKKKQATIGLEFRKLIGKPSVHIAPKDLTKRIELYNRMKVLNHRGKEVIK